MNTKIMFAGLLVLLSACGGGSSSGGSGGELGRCKFSVDGNNIPQVSISVSTSDQTIDQTLRSACGLALSKTRNEVKNCLTSPTTSDMYPTVIRTKDEYILEKRTSNGSGESVIRNHGGTTAELPDIVRNSVVSSWMFTNGYTTSFGCGSYLKQ